MTFTALQLDARAMVKVCESALQTRYLGPQMLRSWFPVDEMGVLKCSVVARPL